MHSDDELCYTQCSALFSVCKIPYSSKDLVRQASFLENGLCYFPCLGFSFVNSFLMQ